MGRWRIQRWSLRWQRRVQGSTIIINVLNSALVFCKTKNSNNPLKRKHMKKLFTLTSIASAMAIVALITACQTVATNSAETAASKKQNLLAQAGFKFIAVT